MCRSYSVYSITQDVYEHHFIQRVLALPSVTVSDVLSQHHRDQSEVQVPYTSHKDFEAKAKKLKIMFDFRVYNFTHTLHTYFIRDLPPSSPGWSAPHSVQGCGQCYVQRPKSSPDSSATLERLRVNLLATPPPLVLYIIIVKVLYFLSSYYSHSANLRTSILLISILLPYFTGCVWVRVEHGHTSFL